MRKLLTVFVAISSLSSLAQGQPQPKNTKPAEIIFGEGDLIDGDISKPDVEFVRHTPGAKFDKLIRIREDFKEKVMSSASEL